MVWTDDKLIVKDPKYCPHDKKRHMDELVQSTEEMEIEGEDFIVSKNLKEIDFDEHSIVHRAVTYSYGSDNDVDFNKVLERVILDPYQPGEPFKGMGQWLIDEELVTTPTATQIREAEEVRMVSTIKDPSQVEGPIATYLNSTFVTPAYVNFVRETIESLRHYRTCQTMHALLGKGREKFLCPICGEYDIYPQELYCHRASGYIYRENQGEWYKNADGEWDVFTWANPYLHTPLVMDLDRNYEAETTKIYFRNNQSLWNFVSGIVPEGETKKDQEGESRKWDIPKDSYLFFDNHYRRYKVNLNRSIEGTYGSNVLGDIDSPNFWMEISPSLKFDVKDGSDITLSHFKVKAKAPKETTTVDIDLSNMFLFDMDDWFEKPSSGPPSMRKITEGWDKPLRSCMLMTLNKFLSPQTQIKFQGHDKVYTIKKADRNLTGTNPFSASIELTEELVKDVNKDEAVFLYTYIKAKHIEEIRTALDNLEMPPAFEYRFWWGPDDESARLNVTDIENCSSTVGHVSTTDWEDASAIGYYEREKRQITYDYYHHCTNIEALRAYANLDDGSIPYFAEPHQCLIDVGKEGTRSWWQYRYKLEAEDPWTYRGATAQFARREGTMDGERPAYLQLGLQEGEGILNFGWYNGWHNATEDAFRERLGDDSQIPLKGTIIKVTVA